MKYLIVNVTTCYDVLICRITDDDDDETSQPQNTQMNVDDEYNFNKYDDDGKYAFVLDT